jgi:small subunit ribosomal protein S2
MKQDGTFLTLSKKERLQVDRLRAKLEKNLGSISEMSRLPAALFIVDTTREHIAVAEAQKLKIPIFAMVDTNSDPRVIDYVIPSNDDASKSIDKIMTSVTNAVIKGLAERKSSKDESDAAAAAKAADVADKAAAAKAAADKAEAAPKAAEEEASKKATRKKVVATKASKEEE